MNAVWKKPSFAILLFAGVFFIVNFAVSISFSNKTSHAFYKKSVGRMKKVKPDIVLIGDSMLGKAVHPDRLSRWVGRKTLRLDHGGSSSAAWYLTLKNVVLKAERKPAAAVIFFRDCFLTMPTYRTSGRYRRHLKDLSAKSEPLLDEIVYNDSPADMFLSRWFPLYRYREQLKNKLDSFVKEDAAAGILRQAPQDPQRAVSRLFQDENMDAEQLNEAQDKAEAETEIPVTDFSRSLERSFLPAMIEEARAASVKLIFVRVKKKRDAEGIPETPELKKYIRDLSRYLSRNDVPLIDFTHEKKIKLKHFANGDHLSTGTGRQVFTKLFAERLAKILPRKKALRKGHR